VRMDSAQDLADLDKMDDLVSISSAIFYVISIFFCWPSYSLLFISHILMKVPHGYRMKKKHCNHTELACYSTAWALTNKIIAHAFHFETHNHR
jgi:hypothetical protein